MEQIAFNTYSQQIQKSRCPTVNYKRDDNSLRMLYSASGLVTEASEILDLAQINALRGGDIDCSRMKEEIGDLMYFVGHMIADMGFDMDDVLEKNLQKIQLRYGDEYTYEKNHNRNGKKEKKIFEEA